ncbi:FAD:protein FMN transferase [Chitinophaga filiformis]|uniref:FAD:protein FMN transferase n=1 Tax=Chitinophaga filiformis TaxID=104663 RepID=UPI001F29171A|nr:FAD:protein FMN transferase [Chitinophaga filiformis]MCF6406052.1 FAD:protein FMN transferase [Chitinophaga filiformis]
MHTITDRLAIIKQLAILLFFFCISATTFAQRLVTLEGKAQGTYYIIKYLSDDTVSLQHAIDSVFAEIDQSLSLYKPGSLINRFNEGNAVHMDHHMQAVVTRALQISKATNGAFDITVKPLVDAWGFGVHKPAVQKVPAADTLRHILSYVGYGYLEIRSQQLIKKKKGVEIDCNGIAQGYTSDAMARLLEQKAIGNYLVDVGGELCSKGHNQHGKIWTVGIERPATDDNAYPVQALLAMDNKAITTSGNYRRFFDQGGTRFAHSINPATGEALHSNIVSVTVIAGDAITADGYDNALILMGVEHGLSFIAQHPEYGLEAYFIYKDEQGKIRERFSPGFEKLLIR